MRHDGSQTDTRPTMFKDTQNVADTGSRDSRTWFQRSLIVSSFLHKDLGNKNGDTAKLTGVKICKSSWLFVYSYSLYNSYFNNSIFLPQFFEGEQCVEGTIAQSTGC